MRKEIRRSQKGWESIILNASLTLGEGRGRGVVSASETVVRLGV